MSDEIIHIDHIRNRIYTIRGIQVMLDEDLAYLYDVETRVLNQAVKRNSNPFPSNFMFQITQNEYESLRSQIVTINKADNLMSQSVISSSGHGDRRKLPYAFTEQGVAMLSAVVSSKTAVKVRIRIMEAFVVMRRFMLTNAKIFQRLDTLEMKQIETDKKVDQVLTAIEMGKREFQYG